MRLRNEYIGTVIAESFLVNDAGERVRGGAYTGRYILYHSWLGFRRYKLVGDPGHSASAEDIRSRVEAWKRGGPLPPLESDTAQPKKAPVLEILPSGRND